MELVAKVAVVMVEGRQILILQVMELMQLVGEEVLVDILDQLLLNQVVSVVPVS